MSSIDRNLFMVSRKRNQNEICLEKDKETNNTSNPCLDVLFWFSFLFTVNNHYHSVVV